MLCDASGITDGKFNIKETFILNFLILRTCVCFRQDYKFVEEIMTRNLYTCVFYILILKVPCLKVSLLTHTDMPFGELVKIHLQTIPREICLVYICIYKICIILLKSR